MIRLLAFVQMRINLINQLFSTGDTRSDLFKSGCLLNRFDWDDFGLFCGRFLVFSV